MSLPTSAPLIEIGRGAIARNVIVGDTGKGWAVKKPAFEQGLKDLHRDFGVVTQPEKTGPAMRDVDTARGALCYVPRNPINHVMAFTADNGSPARGHHAPGRVLTEPGNVPKRNAGGFPESQIPGSRNVTPGGEGRRENWE